MLYSDKYRASTWANFVPYQNGWGRTIWIELARERLIPPEFLSGREVLARWQAENAYGHNFMPEIEAAYLARIIREDIASAQSLVRIGL